MTAQHIRQLFAASLCFSHLRALEGSLSASDRPPLDLPGDLVVLSNSAHPLALRSLRVPFSSPKLWRGLCLLSCTFLPHASNLLDHAFLTSQPLRSVLQPCEKHVGGDGADGYIPQDAGFCTDRAHAPRCRGSVSRRSPSVCGSLGRGR